MAKRVVQPDVSEPLKFDSAASYTTLFNCSVSDNTTSTLSGNGMDIVVDSGQSIAYAQRSTSAVDISQGGLFTLLVFFNDTPAANAQIGIEITDGNFSTDSQRIYFPAGLKKGWNVLKWRTGPGAPGWTTFGGGISDWSAIIAWRVRLLNLPGASLTVDSLWYGGFIKPCITFGLDRGFSSQATLGINSIQQAGLNGVYLSVDRSNVDTSGYVSTNTLSSLSQAGVEILGVGVSSESLSSDYSGSGIFWESEPSQNDVDSSITSNTGIYNTTTSNHVAIGVVNSNPNPLRMSSYSLGSQTLTQAKAKVDSSIDEGSYLIISIPKVVEGGDGTSPPVASDEWYQNDLVSLGVYIFNKVRDGYVKCQTPKQWIESLV